MTPDPIGAAKVVAGVASAAHGALDATTKSNGPVSRLLGLDLLHQDFKSLRRELEKFTDIVQAHHAKHEQSTQAIGMLLQEFKHFQERVTDRLESSARVADVRASAQDQALRDFESRLQLLGELVKERLGNR